MGIRGIIRAQIYVVIVLVGSTGLFAGLCKNDQYGPDGITPCDPGTYNEWLKNNNGYWVGEAVDINEDIGLDVYSRYQVCENGYADGQNLDNDLEAGRPVDMWTPLVGSHHWLVAKGKIRKGWFVSDCYWDDTKWYQYDPNNQTGGYQQIQRFLGNWGPQPPPTGKSIITLHTSSFEIGNSLRGLSYPVVELLLTDPQGKRTGYESITGSIIEEIPNSSYMAYEVGVPFIPGDTIPGTLCKKLKIKPVLSGSGSYHVEAIGVNSGIYILNFGTFDNNQKYYTTHFKSITSPNITQSYQLDFDPSGAQPTRVTKVASSLQIKQSLQTAFDQNWIDNKGILNSLMKKLENAEAAFARGQIDTTINKLNAFINEVKAQKGKHIKEEAADILINDAQTLIEQIQ